MGRKVCERCNTIPRFDDAFHRGIGAKSLVADINICSDCGVDEGYENYLYGKITPKSEWPINK